MRTGENTLGIRQRSFSRVLESESLSINMYPANRMSSSRCQEHSYFLACCQIGENTLAAISSGMALRHLSTASSSLPTVVCAMYHIGYTSILQSILYFINDIML